MPRGVPATGKANVLTAAQSYKLHRWLDDRRAMAEARPARALSEKAQADLGFRITEANVQGARNNLGMVVLGQGSEQHRFEHVTLARSILQIRDRLAEQNIEVFLPGDVRRIAGCEQESLPLKTE